VLPISIHCMPRLTFCPGLTTLQSYQVRKFSLMYYCVVLLLYLNYACSHAHAAILEVSASNRKHVLLSVSLVETVSTE